MHQECFESIKEEVCCAGILTPFDNGKKSTITVDASACGIGAVLAQIHPTGEKTVAFASRSLTDSERNYSVIEREALAAAWGMEYFRVYVWGTRVTLHFDHKPLLKMLSSGGAGKCSARLARLAARLQEYMYDLEYIPGWRNVQADCLSRLPLGWEVVDGEGVLKYESEGAVASVCDVTHWTLGAVSKEEWERAFTHDEVLMGVVKMIVEGGRRESTLPPALRPYGKVLDELSILDKRVLVRGERLIPPVGVRKRLFDIAHEEHLGQTMSKKRLRAEFWWPGMDDDVVNWVERCSESMESEKRLKVGKQTVCGTMRDPGIAWHTVCGDFIGPIAGVSYSQRFAFVLIDLNTKWLVVKFMAEVTTVSTMRVLSEIFSEECYPDCLITDNGTQLTSDRIKLFLNECGVKHAHTSLYNPQGNGTVERANRVVKGAIQLALANRLSVGKVVSDLVWAYRSTVHNTLVSSLFELKRGRKPSTKLTLFWIKSLLEGNSLEEECQKGESRNTKKISSGDWVKIKSGRCAGGLNKFRGPFQVKHVGRWHVVLENGEKWNFRRVARFGAQDSKFGTQRSECEGSVLGEDEGVTSESRSSTKDIGSNSLAFNIDVDRPSSETIQDLKNGATSFSKDLVENRVSSSQTSGIESSGIIPEVEQYSGSSRRVASCTKHCGREFACKGAETKTSSYVFARLCKIVILKVIHTLR
ncbi:hypothetical protein NDU88_001315 [Pleurodeles waltl]|uniref:Gypsy retrotransposon integrase-like protein 1 n=1 Tax=Pleurodeles waltl TaxID=8319 RepID=A0AAV7USF8_PLEWA|nr:hypothetical protein NDU88_001315 [Pleurodeles waltl]